MPQRIYESQMKRHDHPTASGNKIQKKKPKREKGRRSARRRKRRASDVQVGVRVRLGRKPACPRDRMCTLRSCLCHAKCALWTQAIVFVNTTGAGWVNDQGERTFCTRTRARASRRERGGQTCTVLAPDRDQDGCDDRFICDILD